MGGLAYVLGLVVSDSQLVAGLSAGVVEIVWALGEFYFKEK